MKPYTLKLLPDSPILKYILKETSNKLMFGFKGVKQYMMSMHNASIDFQILGDLTLISISCNIDFEDKNQMLLFLMKVDHV
jgi:hypothetical protein